MARNHGRSRACGRTRRPLRPRNAKFRNPRRRKNSAALRPSATLSLITTAHRPNRANSSADTAEYVQNTTGGCPGTASRQRKTIPRASPQNTSTSTPVATNSARCPGVVAALPRKNRTSNAFPAPFRSKTAPSSASRKSLLGFTDALITAPIRTFLSMGGGYSDPGPPPPLFMRKRFCFYPSAAIALNAMAWIAFPCAGGRELAAREIMENAVVSSKFRAW